jgi:hypothetical protein
MKMQSLVFEASDHSPAQSLALTWLNLKEFLEYEFLI